MSETLSLPHGLAQEDKNYGKRTGSHRAITLFEPGFVPNRRGESEERGVKTQIPLDPANQSSSALVSVFKVKRLAFPRIFNCFESQEVLQSGRAVV